ncbi:MAG: phytanoyl-CoA dioxygenase family protein [Gammaproteobacteria bacterium]|nr:phytanoyl-CoA dioxygenase family protein [Gammaproteobacteria bacterium]
MTEAIKTALAERGYAVVDAVVPKPLCEAVIEAVASFLRVDPGDASTWGVAQGHGIVPLHHHPALWEVRQHPAVHAIFTELYGSRALWSSVDRASFKPPAGDETVRVSKLHWDADPRQPKDAAGYQGLVYLTDTHADQGAFCCAPEIYRDLPDWLEAHRDSITDALAEATPHAKRVGGKAGSLLIWSRLMPHSSARNDSARPRWVQYVTMSPAADEAARLKLGAAFREKRAPAWALRQKVQGQRDPEPGPVAELTPLGRRLAGLEAWPPRAQAASV